MGYSCLLNFNSVGNELAKKLLLSSLVTNKPIEEEKLKNFDEWTEELSKAVFTQVDENDGKGLLKEDDILVDDDFDEE